MMTVPILQQIRQAAAQVADESRWCGVNYASLMSYPEVIGLGLSENMTHDPSFHLLGAGDATATFFLVLDTINFGSGYFPFIDKERGPSGYFSIAGRLKDWFHKEGVPSCERLRNITPSECSRIFGQTDVNSHSNELMWLFSLSLNDLGRYISEEFRGNLNGIFLECDDANQFLARILKMPLYRDEHMYGSLRVPFHKRAQILIQDIAIALPTHPVARFPDLDQLTAFADNVIPYVLVVDGLLTLDPWLERRIEQEELIGSGSIEEIELRACAIHAVEQLRELMSDEGGRISSRQLDFLLWNRGQSLKKNSARKRHRTRSVFY